jgi:hypothetical protein
MKNAPMRRRRRKSCCPGRIIRSRVRIFPKRSQLFGDRDLQTNDRLTDEVWRELADVSTDPALIGYTIAEADVVHFPRRFRRGWKT